MKIYFKTLLFNVKLFYCWFFLLLLFGLISSAYGQVSEADNESKISNTKTTRYPSCYFNSPKEVCAGSVYYYTGPRGMNRYKWTVTGNAYIKGRPDRQTVAVQAGSGNGSYTIKLVTKKNGRESRERCAAVVKVIKLRLDGYVTNASCSRYDGRIDLTVSGGSGYYRYKWSNGATTEDIYGLAPGWYSVTVIDRKSGCSGYAKFEVKGSAPIYAGYAHYDPIPCGKYSTTVTIKDSRGDYLEYSIDGGKTYQESNVFYNVPAGWYTVCVRNKYNKDCYDCGKPFEIKKSEGVYAGTAYYEPIPCGKYSTTVTIKDSKGEYLQYSIDGGKTYYDSNVFYDVKPGWYTVCVRNKYNYECYHCGDKFEIKEPVRPYAGYAHYDPIPCGKYSTTVTIKDSRGDYLEYSIDGGKTYQESNVFYNVPAGWYTVCVRNKYNKDCYDCGKPFEIKKSEGVYAGTAYYEPIPCGKYSTTVTIKDSKGEYLQYSIDGGKTYYDSNVFYDVKPGWYTVCVRNKYNYECYHCGDKFEIKEPVRPYAGYAHYDPIPCGKYSTTVTIKDSRGDYLEYSIDGGKTYQESNVFYNVPAGWYTVCVRNKYNKDCYDCGKPFEIKEPEKIELYAKVRKIKVDEYGNITRAGSIDLDVKGGSGDFEYKWFHNKQLISTSEDLFDLTDPGRYRLVIIDKKTGCRVVCRFNVKVKPYYPCGCKDDEDESYDKGEDDTEETASTAARVATKVAPENISLSVFPNTVKTDATIQFTTDKATTYTVEVINSVGQVVKQIASGNAVAGEPVEYKLNGTLLELNRVNFIRVRTNNKAQVFKVFRE